MKCSEMDNRAIIGFCHYKNHSGYLTKSLVKEHECLKKQCPLLEKFDCRYFTQKDNIKKAKQIQKQRSKRKKKSCLFIKKLSKSM